MVVHFPGRLTRKAPQAVSIGLMFAALLLVACHRPARTSADVSVQTEIAPQPIVPGPATVMVRLTDGQGRPLANAAVTVEGNMTHPGMSPTFAQAKELSAGHYQATTQFSMVGDWVVSLHIRLPGGQALEREIDARVVGP
jgi:hypothetical protein